MTRFQGSNWKMRAGVPLTRVLPYSHWLRVPLTLWTMTNHHRSTHFCKITNFLKEKSRFLAEKPQKLYFYLSKWRTERPARAQAEARIASGRPVPRTTTSTFSGSFSSILGAGSAENLWKPLFRLEIHKKWQENRKNWAKSDIFDHGLENQLWWLRNSKLGYQTYMARITESRAFRKV